jgi:hypothetical protein
MQHTTMQTLVFLAMVNGVHCTWQHATNIQSFQARPALQLRAPTSYMFTQRLPPMRAEPASAPAKGKGKVKAKALAPAKKDDAALATKDDEGSGSTALATIEEQVMAISKQSTGVVDGVVGVPRTKFLPPKQQPSLYSQGIMGKPTSPPTLPGFERHSKGIEDFFGGPFKSPVEKPSLYSQGITGKKVFKPPQPAYGSPLGWQKGAATPAAKRVGGSMPDTAAASVATPTPQPQLEAQSSSAESLAPLALISGVALTVLYFRRRPSPLAKESLLTAA